MRFLAFDLDERFADRRRVVVKSWRLGVKNREWIKPDAFGQAIVDEVAIQVRPVLDRFMQLAKWIKDFTSWPRRPWRCFSVTAASSPFGSITMIERSSRQSLSRSTIKNRVVFPVPVGPKTIACRSSS